MTAPDENKRSEENAEDTQIDEAFSWRKYKYVIAVCLLFIGLSVYYALTYFPELSTTRAVIAGLGFGIFCSMCAATYSQLI